LEYSLDQRQLDQIETVLQKNLISEEIDCAVIIDMAGNIITDQNNGRANYDIYSLAALAAGNFGAVNAIANIIGEREFSLLYHKGKNKSIHFSRLTSDFLLVTIFGVESSLGYVRLKVAETVEKIQRLLKT